MRRNSKQPRRIRASRTKMTPMLIGRDRPYGIVTRTPRKPRLTSLNPVIQVQIALNPSIVAESTITVGQVAAAISQRGYSVSSYTITRVDCYGHTTPATTTETAGSLFRYVPTNQAWIIESTDNVTAGTLSYIPPAVSSGPFSSGQAGSQLFVVAGLQAIIIRASVVTVQAAPPALVPVESSSSSDADVIETLSLV